jgi:hypothetical protein
MSCSSPKNCGECDGCIAADNEHERKLDVVHAATEKVTLTVTENVTLLTSNITHQ